LVIVVNDLAPRAHVADWQEIFQRALGAEVEVTEVHVNSFEGARAAARGAAAWHYDVVVAVGGDGTINACINGIGSAPTRLAVIPAGTANDLARVLSSSKDPRAAASAAGDWCHRDIDSISVNDTHFYSVGGVGWGAETAALANRWRASSLLARKLLARLGSAIYTVATVMVILFSRRLGAHFSIRYWKPGADSESLRELQAYGILVANFSRVGKSFQLAPQSDPGDGVFELILIPRTGRLGLLRTVLAATRGTLMQVPGVEVISAERALIESDQPMKFFGDGETLADNQQRLALEMSATPVRLMAPAPVAEAVRVPSSAVLAEA
jgi:diacylglycerol kinase (ATP)